MPEPRPAPCLYRSLLLAMLIALLLASPGPAMDQVRVLTGADAATATYGVNGRGVIVALLDRGIDWKNADFRNADGTTRIAYIFDLTDDTGAAAVGNPYGKGTLYTRQQIDAALAGGATLATRDAVGHGTTTAAIAAGGGRNAPSGKYRGIAPEATIISVKVTSDGVPAHDTEPAEAAYYQPDRLPVAIDFVRDKARELGLPAVMLLNLGSQGGPTDDTSDLDRKIDATVGPGIPGLVFVTGAGDQGGVPNRAAGTVPQGGSVPIQIQKGTAASAPLTFDLFYPASDQFTVMIQSPSGTFGPYTAPATNAGSLTQTTADFQYFQNGSQRTFSGALTGKRQIWIRLLGPAGTYTVTLTGATVTTGRFDATLVPSDLNTSSNRFLTNVAPGSLWDGCAARNNICPNAYVSKTTWTDIDGVARNLSGQGNPGEIWTGSSIGPTFDGRFGIDVSSPGSNLVTTYNPKSYFATFRGNLIRDGNGLYGIANAVSAAAPSVTGIIALMLQANPSLDASAVKQILQQTAKADSFTGAVPNNTWGYGKVDALGAVRRAVTTPCAASPANLCLTGGRFRVKVDWSVPSQARSGSGTAVALTGDTGYFWFFSSNNIELVIKVVDGRALNNRFWVFYGALSDVQYTILVEDTVTGAVKTYSNPSGNLASVADTNAFAGSIASPAGMLESSASPGASADELQETVARVSASFEALRSQSDRRGVRIESARVSQAPAVACAADAQTLCLNGGRFQVRVAWQVPTQGTSGAGTGVGLTGDTGYFWFFSSNNVELVIKVLDGRALNNKFWVFYGALSDVQYTITVTDSQTGTVKTYANSQGSLASVADTSAF